jgi:Flp pilus assembly protein TadG
MIRRRMNRSGTQRDTGVAAVEFALVFSLLLTVAVMIWPLGEALYQKMQMDRAMSDVIRYTTADPNSPEPVDDNGAASSLDAGTSVRPDCTAITNEFFRAYYGAGGGSRDGFSPVAVTANGASACPSGPYTSNQTVTITVTKSVNLGPLGDLLSFAGITPTNKITVSAAASGREE